MAATEILLPVRDYDLAATLESGQVFRWRQMDNAWHGFIGKNVVRLTQTENSIHAETAVPVENWDWLRQFLQSEIDLGAVLKTFPDDEPMRAAVAACRGLRLLRQDPWECLASFILSSTKQIVQIRQIVALLCARFGERLAPPPPIQNGFYYSFPTAEKTSLTLKELRRHISGKYLTLKGYVYTVNDSEPSFPSSIRNLPVRKFDRNGVLLETYQNAKLAAIGVGLSYHSVWDALSLHHGTNKAGGTFWAYDDGTVFKKVVTESNRRQVVVFNKADDKVDQLLCVQDFVKKYGIDRNTVYSKLLKTGAIHRTKKIGVRYATEYDEKI